MLINPHTKQHEETVLMEDVQCARSRFRRTSELVIGNSLIWARHCAFCIPAMMVLFAGRCDVFLFGSGMRHLSG